MLNDQSDSQSRHYYRNTKEGTFRVVQMITPNFFAVVKGFEGTDAHSLKFWAGDLETVSSYWNTIEFWPSEVHKCDLDAAFEYTIMEFAPAMTLLLGQI